MILNSDQTLSNYAPVSTRTLAERNSKHFSISGLSDKQAITATFDITFSNAVKSMVERLSKVFLNSNFRNHSVLVQGLSISAILQNFEASQKYNHSLLG